MSWREGSSPPTMCWAIWTILCRAFRLRVVQFPYQAEMQPVRMLSTVQLPEDFWAQTEFRQSPEEEETPVGLPHYWPCVNSPGEVLGDVYAEELDAADPLHWSPVDGDEGCPLVRLLKSTTSSLVLLMFRERLLLWHQLVRVCTTSL